MDPGQGPRGRRDPRAGRHPGRQAAALDPARRVVAPGSRTAPRRCCTPPTARSTSTRSSVPRWSAAPIVISDRYIDSSVAYQGAGRDLSPTEIARIYRWATDGLVPHLTVLLDVSPEAARERFTEAPDRLESEPAEFHARVRSGFLTLAAADPGRYLVVDAGQEPEAVTTVVRHRLDADAAALRGRGEGPGGGAQGGRGGGPAQGRGRGRPQGGGGAPGARAPGAARASSAPRRRSASGASWRRRSGARPSGRRRRPGSAPRRPAAAPRRSGSRLLAEEKARAGRRAGAARASRPRRRRGCVPRRRSGAWRSSARPRRRCCGPRRPGGSPRRRRRLGGAAASAEAAVSSAGTARSPTARRVRRPVQGRDATPMRPRSPRHPRPLPLPLPRRPPGLHGRFPCRTTSRRCPRRS